MKKNIILVAVAIILLLLGIRGCDKSARSLDEEKIRFVRNLKYDFTANVDSIGAGVLLCKIKSGSCNKSTEYSLNQHLTKYKHIQFLKFREDGQIEIRPLPPDFETFRVNDSLLINSLHDKFQLVRNGEIVVDTRILYLLYAQMPITFWLPN